MDPIKYINLCHLPSSAITCRKLLHAQPFSHLVLPHFLDEHKARTLLRSLKKEQFELKQSDLFSLYQTPDLITSTHPAIQHFRTLLSSPQFTQYLHKITKIKIKPHHIDMAGTIYTDTNYLLPHDDQLSGRKIAYIYYLSSLKKSAGGALAFYASKNNRPPTIVKRIQPQFNTLILFPVTKISFHEVEEVLTKAQRIAISGWFHG